MTNTRADKAHAIAKKAYDAAMRELSKSDDLGIMFAACAKCGTWLTAEVAAAAYLQSDETASVYMVGMADKECGDD